MSGLTWSKFYRFSAIQYIIKGQNMAIVEEQNLFVM